MYFRRKTAAGRTYLLIVESRRDGDQVRVCDAMCLARLSKLSAAILERIGRFAMSVVGAWSL